MRKSYQICTRCVMDTTDPDIKFNEDGVCNHCRNYDLRAAKDIFQGEEGKEKLLKLVQRIKKDGRGKQYDCVIGLSGGVDSSLVAYYVKQLGLRPLAITLDNGWNSETSESNIDNIVKKLGFDLYKYVIDWEEFRDLQVSFFKSGICNLEIPTDHAISAIMVNTATKKGIKYFITGYNLATEGILPDSWGYDSFDLKLIHAIHRKFGKVPLSSFPQLGLLPRLYYVYMQRLREVPLLDYVDYNRSEAELLLKKEIGWRDYGGKHGESIFTRFYQGFIATHKFGYDKRRAHLSSMICSGQMTRIEALEIVMKDPYPSSELLHEDKEYVIKKLGFSEEEFDQLMAAPVKTYREYPNDDALRQTLRMVRSLLLKMKGVFQGH